MLKKSAPATFNEEILGASSSSMPTNVDRVRMTCSLTSSPSGACWCYESQFLVG